MNVHCSVVYTVLSVSCLDCSKQDMLLMLLANMSSDLQTALTDTNHPLSNEAVRMYLFAKYLRCLF